MYGATIPLLPNRNFLFKCARGSKVILMVEPPKPKTSWASFTHIIDLLRPKKADEHAQGHRSIAVKCDLCFDVDGGPACVRNCPTGAAIRRKHGALPATVMKRIPQA